MASFFLCTYYVKAKINEQYFYYTLIYKEITSVSSGLMDMYLTSNRM